MLSGRMLLLVLVLCSTLPASASAAGLSYRGMCDASAAVAIGTSTFIVASDEDNILRLYQRDHPQPLQYFDLNPILNLDAKHPEADIEAAARLGDHIYWITSHGTNSRGKQRVSRHNLFALRVQGHGDRMVLQPVGHSYSRLVQDMMHAPQLKSLQLDRAARLPAKGAGGLNIEALAASGQGSLLIGLRNPLLDGKAILIPLLNPQQLLQGGPARFDVPILLELGGLGLRGMAYNKALGQYIMIAGASGRHGPFRLYRWSGLLSDQPKLMQGTSMHGLNPETVLVYPQAGMQLLSDDGRRKLATVRCKRASPQVQHFRSQVLSGG